MGFGNKVATTGLVGTGPTWRTIPTTCSSATLARTGATRWRSIRSCVTRAARGHCGARRRSPSGVSHRKRRSASRRGSNLYWLRLWSSAPYRRQFFFQRSQLSVAPANGLADRFLKVLTVLVFAVVDQFVVRADYYDVRFFARGGLG